MWLPEFTLEESLELLRRRVTGFPDMFLTLCHCLAGGLPRDLVRAARSLIDARLYAKADELGVLAKQLIRSEIAAYMRGMLRELQHLHQRTPASVAPSSPPMPLDPNNNAVPGEPLMKLLLGSGAHNISSSLKPEARRLAKMGNEQAAALSAVLSYYALVEELFVKYQVVVSRALREPADIGCIAIIEEIASVRAYLSISPRLASEQVADLRRRLAYATT